VWPRQKKAKKVLHYSTTLGRDATPSGSSPARLLLKPKILRLFFGYLIPVIVKARQQPLMLALARQATTVKF